MDPRSDLRHRHKENSMAAILLLTGFIVGTLDASAAVLRYTLKTGQNPIRIFKYIASGVFGDSALNGGMAMAAWGLFFHYTIAFCFTIFFFFIYPVLFRLIRNKVLTGLFYGLFIWALMNLVIVPLSASHPAPLTFESVTVNILILMVCIGLPVALMVGRYYEGEQKLQNDQGRAL